MTRLLSGATGRLRFIVPPIRSQSGEWCESERTRVPGRHPMRLQDETALHNQVRPGVGVGQVGPWGTFRAVRQPWLTENDHEERRGARRIAVPLFFQALAGARDSGQQADSVAQIPSDSTVPSAPGAPGAWPPPAEAPPVPPDPAVPPEKAFPVRAGALPGVE